MTSLEKASRLIFSHQFPEGYWWYTLEANETIGSGFIQLMHFVGEVDSRIQEGLVHRMFSQQRPDGSWAVFFEGPGDLSTTVECYFALKLAGVSTDHPSLKRARDFILGHGGLERVRVFTKIHLALFGIVPWSSCPAMPVWLVLLPVWSRFSIYEFSSWARASIVPLLILGEAKPVRNIPFGLDELRANTSTEQEDGPKRFPSWKSFFCGLDRVLKMLEKFPWHPGKKAAMAKAQAWVREHIARTEDIYPAMAYSVMALSAMGYPNSDPTIQKALDGLKRFRQTGPSGEIHQQCCISPNWDTPWAGMALLESGVDPKDPRLLKAARYLISKEVRDFRGDWRMKNPSGPAGGWSFEFQNDYFPDIDDTIEAIFFLRRVGIPEMEKSGPVDRGLAWLLSMQSDNGGWAAFDKDNVSNWVNKIPFSDHGACLDPPTPDITGRMVELLCGFGRSHDDPVLRKAVSFLQRSQESNGSWRGRWGVNYIYGTWCVLQGLRALGEDSDLAWIRKAADWLEAVQNQDGGWGESCLSDSQNTYVPLGISVPSQTSWALMGLIAAGEKDSPAVRRGIQWLIENQDESGGWDEPYFTGTGFPGHFYINYHGYRLYFPLLALGKFNRLKE